MLHECQSSMIIYPEILGFGAKPARTARWLLLEIPNLFILGFNSPLAFTSSIHSQDRFVKFDRFNLTNRVNMKSRYRSVMYAIKPRDSLLPRPFRRTLGGKCLTQILESSGRCRYSAARL